MLAMHALLLLLIFAVDDVPPSKDAPRGKVHSWKGATGAYEYTIPKSYDHRKGATLTVMLHGSNLTRTWAFANFKAGTFRKDDILVAPDGTTSNGQGGFNFLVEKDDAKQVADLIRDLKKRLTINRVYVYGHSQGAYFIYYFIGEHPNLVDGVCAHAGGVRTESRFPDKAKDIAIGILHSKDDPVVPFSLSETAEELYKKKKYKNVFFKRTDKARHMPHLKATEEVLGWCDRVTARDAAESAKLAEEAVKQKEYAIAWDLAQKILSGRIPMAKKAALKKAKAVADKVEKEASARSEKILAAAKGDAKRVPPEPEFGPWVIDYRGLTSDFPGSDALKALQKKLRPALKKHGSTGKKYYKKFKSGGAAKQYAAAFRAGRLLLEKAFLCPWTDEVRTALDGWAKEIGDRLPAEDLDAYRKLREARKSGND